MYQYTTYTRTQLPYSVHTWARSSLALHLNENENMSSSAIYQYYNTIFWETLVPLEIHRPFCGGENSVKIFKKEIFARHVRTVMCCSFMPIGRQLTKQSKLCALVRAIASLNSFDHQRTRFNFTIHFWSWNKLYALKYASLYDFHCSLTKRKLLGSFFS